MALENLPTEPAAPAVIPPQPAAPAAPVPPRAAITVMEGRTERESDLERELESERTTRKSREVRISELEDENYRLKGGRQAAPPAAEKQSDPWTFFDGED